MDSALNILPQLRRIETKTIEHYEYCKSNCFKFNYSSILFEYKYFPHTKKCHEMRTDHFNSYFDCKAKYCIAQNKKYGFIPTYSSKDLEESIHGFNSKLEFAKCEADQDE